MTCRASLDADTTITVGVGKSLQDEYDRLAKDFDLRGFAVNFVLEEGCSPALNAKLPLVGGNAVSINGGNVVNSLNTGRTPFSNHVCGLTLNLKNMRLAGWNGAPALVATMGGVINLQEGIIFGAGDNDHILASYCGKVFINKDYAVTGGGLNHWHSYSDGYITAVDITVSNAPGIWFNARWAGVADASLIARNVKFTSTQYQDYPKYLVHKNGFLEIGTAILPGNIGGTVVPGSVIA